MKRFIKRLLIFISFTIIIVIVSQIIISIRISGKMVKGSDNLGKTSNINADLVFLGSSRCWVHFDPHFFDTTYNLKSVNLGVDGHSEMSMAIVRLQTYLLKNKPPKFVVLSFDPLMYSGDFINNSNFSHKDDFATYAFMTNKDNLLLVDYFNFTKFEKYLPLYAVFKYQLLLNSIFLNNNNRFKLTGYQHNTGTWDIALNPPPKKIEDHIFEQDKIANITNALDSLKKLCFKNKIKLMCIQTPIYKINLDNPKFITAKDICNNLNIPFINANKDFISNNINCFYNTNHLNVFGVNQMNTFLKQDSALADFFKM